MRKLFLKIVIKLVRRYFSDGISVITDNEENIIAYQWAWTKDLEKEIFK